MYVWDNGLIYITRLLLRLIIRIGTKGQAKRNYSLLLKIMDFSFSRLVELWVQSGSLSPRKLPTKISLNSQEIICPSTRPSPYPLSHFSRSNQAAHYYQAPTQWTNLAAAPPPPSHPEPVVQGWVTSTWPTLSTWRPWPCRAAEGHWRPLLHMGGPQIPPHPLPQCSLPDSPHRCTGVQVTTYCSNRTRPLRHSTSKDKTRKNPWRTSWGNLPKPNTSRRQGSHHSFTQKKSHCV